MKAKSISIDFPRVESVPEQNWRDKIKAGELPNYSFSVSGQSLVTLEDGSCTRLDVQFRIKGIKRTNSLNGLLDKTSWKFQPPRSATLAKAATKSVVRDGGKVVEEFDLADDGKFKFDEAGLNYDDACLGLPLLGYHVQGKTLVLEGAAYEAKKVPTRDGSQKIILEVSSVDGLQVIDTPVISGSIVADEDEAEITGVVAAAARKGKAVQATLEIK